MQSVLRSCQSQLRRLYSTKAPLPELAKVARTASTPLAVRLRREKQHGPTELGETDATKDGLTPTDHARYTRLRATGELTRPDGSIPTPREWAETTDERRSRVRGFRRRVIDGVELTEVVGQKVYLPNIVVRLVRNNTPPGEPYNPYEATFRIPQSVTKTDIRSYLLAVYGVKTTYIRTDNYISPWYRTQEGFRRRPHKTYKRAVVGLVDPFYYPHRLEDMPEQQRKEREELLERNFAIQHQRNLRKQELLRATMGEGRAAWKFKAPYATKRSHIIRLVNERRANREALNAKVVEGVKSLRQAGKKVSYAALKDKLAVPPPSDSSSQSAPSP